MALAAVTKKVPSVSQEALSRFPIGQKVKWPSLKVEGKIFMGKIEGFDDEAEKMKVIEDTQGKSILVSVERLTRCQGRPVGWRKPVETEKPAAPKPKTAKSAAPAPETSELLDETELQSFLDCIDQLMQQVEDNNKSLSVIHADNASLKETLGEMRDRLALHKAAMGSEVQQDDEEEEPEPENDEEEPEPAPQPARKIGTISISAARKPMTISGRDRKE